MSNRCHSFKITRALVDGAGKLRLDSQRV